MPDPLLERYEPLPFVLSGPAGYWQPAVSYRPDGQLATVEVADVPVDVCGEEVIVRVGPLPHRFVQFTEIGGLQHAANRLQPQVGCCVGRPLDGNGVTGGGVADDDGPMVRDGDIQLHRLRASDFDNLVADLGLLPLPFVLVEQRRAFFEALDIQVLDVAVGGGNTPGNLGVVPEVWEPGTSWE